MGTTVGTNLCLMAKIGVISHTGKTRRRNASARGHSAIELTANLVRAIERIEDPRLLSIRIEVLRPATGELEDFLEGSGDEAVFSWPTCHTTTRQVIDALTILYPTLKVEQA